jgi:lysophospholipase L1-like esterase
VAKRTSIGLATVLAGLALVSASTAAASAPVFYVALGDSLATGAQPAPSGVKNGLLAANGTNRGYVDVLHAAMRERIPNLQLRDFGCGGETTTSLIDGSFPNDVRCGYERSSQLAEAVAFLRAHPGEIAFVTLDIGANDVFAGGGVPAIAANLPVILGELRGAVGPDVPIVGMNYYDPFVAPVWFATHDLGALEAEVAGTIAFNDFLEGIYASFGMAVADVESAFSLTDSTIQSDGLPLNVQRACAWTWMCSVGDIHATDPGYAAIARSFLEVLQP